MAQPRIINTEIRNCQWHGTLIDAGDTAPQITVTHLGATLDGITCTHDSDHAVWHIAAPIPANLISEGVQSFLIHDGDRQLGQFAVMAGDVLADDLQAEVALLRSELDLLKSAFRRHCRDTGSD